jgi:hypothetical protein
MDPAEFDRRIGDALRRLPAPRPPADLVPRIMAAVQARQAGPWYRRSWVSWPAAGRLAVATTAIALVALSVVPVQSGATAMARLFSELAVGAGQDLWPRLPAGLHHWIGVAGSVETVWRLVVEPFVRYVSAVTIAMGCALVAGGLALARLALEYSPVLNGEVSS